MTDRTDVQILSAEPIVVVLGGREFNVGPQVLIYNMRFCEKANKLLGGLQVLTRTAGAIDLEHLKSTNLIGIIPIVKALLGDIGPGLFELLFEYNKELADAREHIEQNATIPECLEALVACFVMAFGPFAKLPRIISKMTGTQSTGADTENP